MSVELDAVTLQIGATIGRVPMMAISSVLMAWIGRTRRRGGEAWLSIGWGLLALGSSAAGGALILIRSGADLPWLRLLLGFGYLPPLFAALPFLAIGLVRLAGENEASGVPSLQSPTRFAVVGALVGVVIIAATSSAAVSVTVRLFWRIMVLSLVQALVFSWTAYVLFTRRWPAERHVRWIACGALLLLAARQIATLAFSAAADTAWFRAWMYLSESTLWLMVAFSMLIVVLDRDRVVEAAQRAALARAAARTASRIAAAHDVLWDIDTDGRVAFVSPSLTRVLGWSSSAVVGQSVTSLIHADDLADFLAADTRAARRHESREYAPAGTIATSTVRFHHADGTWVLLESHHSPADELILGVRTHLLSRDVSEREATVALRLRAQRLDTMQRVAGGVAHDFNSLITTTLIAAETVRDVIGEGAHDAAGALDDIAAAAKRGAALTRQLQVAAMDASAVAEEMSLSAAVESSLPAIAAVIGDRMRVDIEQDAPAPRVTLPRAHLREMLLAVAEHAAQRTGGTGTLTLRIDALTRAAPRAVPDVPTPVRSYARVLFRVAAGDVRRLNGYGGTPAGLQVVVAIDLVERAGGFLVFRDDGDVMADLHLPAVSA